MRRAGLLCAAALAWAGAAWAAPPADERIDALMRSGWDRPDAALAALRDLPPVEGDIAAARLRLLARGTVLAQNGREAEAQRSMAALRSLARQRLDPQAEAAARVVQALLAQNAAQLDVAASLARAAADQLQAHCPPLSPLAVSALRSSAVADAVALPAAPAPCEHRAAWQALLILQQHALHSGDRAAATEHSRLAHELAATAGDEWRRAWSAADLAWLRARSEGFDAALPVLQQAGRLAQRLDDPMLRARVLLAEAQMAGQRGDLDGVRRLAEQALPLARQAGSPRLQAAVLTFLSDAHTKLGQPAEALRAAERGLPIARAHRDRLLELALRHNAGLAQIGLGRIDAGLQELARLEALAEGAGLLALQAEMLREYDEALAAAGEPKAALALFHRERAISAELMRRHREAALKQLQRRHDVDQQQRDIEMLARDNQLQAALLANRETLQRTGVMAALALVLAAAAMLLVYGQLRRRQRQLQSSQEELRVQSERDPLTHLANRRHLLSLMQAAGQDGRRAAFSGALLLIDIDHFKHVNDGYGHAAGDQVLCEVARRLCDAVRGDDLVVRWGGEEFLVLARQLPAEQPEAAVEQLAERVLRQVGERPVVVHGQAVPVTVSIGYARFPLPPQVLPVAWEQAINLADMALYTAKNQGRNRAVGIVAAQAEAEPELRHIEADFDRAWHEGRVTLKVAPGPAVMAA